MQKLKRKSGKRIQSAKKKKKKVNEAKKYTRALREVKKVSIYQEKGL